MLVFLIWALHGGPACVFDHLQNTSYLVDLQNASIYFEDMTPPKDKRKTGCPVAFALDVFGDRWTLLIIRDLLLRGDDTYGAFLNAGEGISTNILADRLRQLEQEEIIESAPDPENGRRRLYRLTKKGAELAPVIMEMIRWSAKFDPNTSARKNVLDRIESDRDAFIAELTELRLKK